jgi:hypothetical protein
VAVEIEEGRRGPGLEGRIEAVRRWRQRQRAKCAPFRVRRPVAHGAERLEVKILPVLGRPA